MDKQFHPTLYNVYNYICMLGLKSIHVSKMDYRIKLYKSLREVKRPDVGVSDALMHVSGIQTIWNQYQIHYCAWHRGYMIQPKSIATRFKSLAGVCCCTLCFQHLFRQRKWVTRCRGGIRCQLFCLIITFTCNKTHVQRELNLKCDMGEDVSYRHMQQIRC